MQRNLSNAAFAANLALWITIAVCLAFGLPLDGWALLFFTGTFAAAFALGSIASPNRGDL